MRTLPPRIPGLCLAACLAWLAAMPAAAQDRRDPATVTLASDLRAAPESGAPVLATLAAGETVSVLEMRGDQARVDAAGKVGWMAVSKLRLGAAGERRTDAGGGSTWLRGITGMLGGATSGQDRSAKVPIGVRGLQREDVASATPDPAAVERLERYRTSPDQAIAYARDAGLASRRVEYPDAPAAAVSGMGTR